jgi:transaldolase/glucose-6-phosphate isomerase
MHIEEDGVRGITSNPAIFMKAIADTEEYKESINSLSPQYKDAKSLYEQLAIHDIQGTADALRTVYGQSKKQDGYVSLEVSPHLARDTNGTLEEARRLWKTVAKENLMIKVPATAEGIPAIEQLISEGFNVNVTLLFSQDAYERVAKAYIAGLEKRSAQGQPLDHVASVASFFISRIDAAIDKLIEEN